MINEIHADELPGVLHSFGGEIEVLSLDCFDTLLWRTSPDPSDMFCELQPPLSRSSRFVAEKTARQQNFVRRGSREVTLAEIYRCALPAAGEQDIAARVAEELALERRHCVAFEPAVALIRNAKRRGLKVIIVSDTYLSTAQLRELIASRIGADAMAQVDQVFASSDYGAGKLTGLFGIVLDKLGIDPRCVLHIGDSPAADLRAALEAGLQAVQLKQGDEPLEEQWRLEAAALLLADPTLRQRAAPLLPHRPHLGQHLRRFDEPGARLGYGTLGPLMYGFATWVREQARELAAEGKPVKVCFLMRDGHLPRLAYDAIATDDDPRSYAVELSRFAAYACSLRGADDVIAYLGTQWDSRRLDALTRQLLFTPAESEALLRKVEQAERPVHALATEVLRPHHLRKIVNRSKTERQGLIRYLRRQVDAQPGDRLLFVDTGSVGTVQNRVQALLEGELGVEVHGRYMLLLDVPRASERKRGFFGPDRVDARLLRAQCNYTSVVEQLCTVAQGSVIGYTDRGEARRLAADFSPGQVASRDRVQSACLQFIAHAAKAATSVAGATTQARFHGALAAYTRLLFLPLHDESEFFQAFVHDVNMGAKETVQMVDADAAREDLMRIGPMYVKSSLRVFGPGELRRHGLDLALQLLARRRLELDLRPTDFRREGLEIPIMVARGQDSTIVRLEALPTHDGFYSVSIPIGRCEFAVGVMFGEKFEWVQLESARVATVRRQFEAFQRHREIDLTSGAVHEQMVANSGGLLHCLQLHSFSFFAPPPAPEGEESHVLRVVFRPLVVRPGAREASPSAAEMTAAV